MKLFGLFDSGKAVPFAREVVADYLKIHGLTDKSKKHAGRKAELAVGLVRRVSDFVRTEKLNFFQRSRLLAEIKNGLIESGVEARAADEFVRTIAVEALRTRGASFRG